MFRKGGLQQCLLVYRYIVAVDRANQQRLNVIIKAADLEYPGIDDFAIKIIRVEFIETFELYPRIQRQAARSTRQKKTGKAIHGLAAEADAISVAFRRGFRNDVAPTLAIAKQHDDLVLNRAVLAKELTIRE